MKLMATLGSSWLIAAVAALALAACDKADNRVKADRGQPTPPQASASTPPTASPPPQTAQADTGGDAKADETAKANDEPMKPMSKDEEDKAMPQPGQNNDHSTLAQDPKQSSDKK
jgi:hypothetical protein